MWRVGVDSGGTFTDVCLVDATTGDVRVWKVPSTPDDPSRAIAHGVVEGLREAAGATPAEVEYFGHGTTVATNALIQHRGADTGLITTEGFRDLLEIGRQRRPHLYDLQADKPPVLVPRARRHEVRERLRHDGRIETRSTGPRCGRRRAPSASRARGRSPCASSIATSTRATSRRRAASWRRSAPEPS
jgi:N-methylhydantoinase A